MAKAQEYTTDANTLQMINNCRLYLRVHTIADITTTDGTTIRPEAYYGSSNEQATPLLWNFTSSTLKWPAQGKPPPHAWKHWQKMLQTLMRKDTTKLRKPLKEWIRLNTTHRQWRHDKEPIQRVPPRTKKLIATTTHPTTWTSRTFQQIDKAQRIDILVSAASTNEHQAFA
jgi:hypothetical protein